LVECDPYRSFSGDGEVVTVVPDGLLVEEVWRWGYYPATVGGEIVEGEFAVVQLGLSGDLGDDTSHGAFVG